MRAPAVANPNCVLVSILSVITNVYCGTRLQMPHLLGSLESV